MTNDSKIYQTVINYATSSIARLSKIFPNLDFWIENAPSGNPAHETEAEEKLISLGS
jgi:hypothetical protein